MLKMICITLFLVQLPGEGLCQCATANQYYSDLLAIEKAGEPPAEKLAKVLSLQKTFTACALPKDSVYARMLHRQGVLEFLLGRPNEALLHTSASLEINASGARAGSRKSAVNSYFNLAYYYAVLTRYRLAHEFYDSCITLGRSFNDSATLYYVSNAYNKKANLYHQTGDYQNAVEAAILGLKVAERIKNLSLKVSLLNERAEAFAALSNNKEAIADVNEAASLIERQELKNNRNDYEHARANNFKTRAVVSAAAEAFSDAMSYHQKAIMARAKTGDSGALAGDYLDAGNTLRTAAIASNKTDYSAVKNYYNTALLLAEKGGDKDIAVKTLNNLAAISFRSKNYSEALTGYHKSLLKAADLFKSESVLANPSHRQCNAVSDKNFLSLLLANKAECLLNLYKQSGDKRYLNAALNTSLLTDSVITDMRHEQTGEQSKLYWRNETREFFTNAVEACYQAGNAGLAFYFMEKSRAVLLNDQLNELGASAQLPPAEAAQEGALQNNVFALQQQLAKLSGPDPAYNEVQVKLFAAKEDLNRYLQTLQARFPAYYQYKYADAVPSLKELQGYLSANGQTFVHYFTNDTVVYVLAITPSSTSLLRQKSNGVGTALFNFLKTCSNLQGLNNDYASFAGQAFGLYRLLFKPLSLPRGRVIVCSDGLTIPFEALTTDAGGRNFLLYDYSFSYVYSATHLLKKFSNPPGKGAFLGVAPVSYAGYLQLPPLTQSAASLRTSASYLQDTKLLTGSDANTGSFLSQLPRYTIVAVFSHASADSAEREPVLFMADSAIALSELQRLQSPATQLMVLSACQTNAGKLATGEGVFSLARGFAAAGIPAITATLWKADEGAIYAITEIFLQNIARGMRKDDALQAAKRSYLQSGSTKNAMPYYWANVVVAGNADPVVLAKRAHWLWWTAGSAVISALLAGLLLRRKKKSRTAS